MHRQRVVEHIAEQLGRVGSLTRGQPAQVAGDRAVEGHGVDPIACALVAVDSCEITVEAIEIDRGVGCGTVGNGVIRQREVCRVAQIDAEGPSVIDADPGDLDLAAQFDGQYAILAAAADVGVAGDD